MSTKDLDSYYPGYEDYEERKVKVPFEDYLKLEKQIENYEKAVEELEGLLYDSEQYKSLEMIELSKTILKDLKEALC